MSNDNKQLCWTALIVAGIATFFFVLFLVVGCGSSKQSVAGRYQYGPLSQYYIVLKSNGDFHFGSTSNETEIWPYEWPMEISMYFEQAGTWRLKGDSMIMLRSMGSERTFGELQEGEIIGFAGSIWRKE